MAPPPCVSTRIGYVSESLQKGPDIGKGQGISEKLLTDNFETKEMNQWPRLKIKRKGIDWKELGKQTTQPDIGYIESETGNHGYIPC
jgi:hypothetical protein